MSSTTTPSPDAIRYTATIAYLADPWRASSFPAPLLRDCEARWRAWEAQEGRCAPHGPSAYAVAAYALGRRDGALAGEGRDDTDRGANALALGIAWTGGFLCCFVPFAVGFLLTR